MNCPCLPVAILILAALALGLGALFGVLSPAIADDEAPEPEPEREKLTDHPLKDAKPGEYLRFIQDDGNWKKYFIERIIDVRDGEVLWEICQTNREGTKDLNSIRKGWKKVPKLKPAPHQRIVEDEMVEMEVNGKKLWCRHLHIDERVNPDWPEPKRRKDVWYSNDIPCSGKVKDTLSKRMVTDWGMMSAEELKKRQDAYRKGEKPREGAPN